MDPASISIIITAVAGAVVAIISAIAKLFTKTPPDNELGLKKV
jgi:hypothetical protein